ncbi:MAG: M48 family metallopeptidase [Burkholderiales bacterium]|nr:M48 family metallopeptidase [Burkholderiales bacterium]
MTTSATTVDASTHASERSVAAVWFDGKSSRRHPARLWRVGDELLLRAAGDATVEGTTDELPLAHAALAEVRVGSRIGDAPYPITFPGGGVALCADHAATDRLLGLGVAHDTVSRLERASMLVAVALAGLVAALWFAYQHLIPAATDFAAQRIPRETERHLGDVALKAMDRYGFKPSLLAESQQEKIRADFDRLAAAAGMRGQATLLFRKQSMNAFALPGGTVVLTDELVRALGDDHDALLAVLAHELGHQAHRDTLRHLISGSLTAVLVGAVTGDVSGVAAISTAVPSIASTLRFSRAIEAEADSYAFDLLRQTGHSPAAFARAMERMRAVQLCRLLRAKDRAAANRAPGPMYDPDEDPNPLTESSSTPERPPARCLSDPADYLRDRDAEVAKLDLEGGMLSYVSTHPATEERIARAKAAR